MKKLTKMYRQMKSKVKDQRGAAMIEYVLMAVAIALVAVIGAGVLGGGLSAKFESINTSLTTPPTK